MPVSTTLTHLYFTAIALQQLPPIAAGGTLHSIIQQPSTGGAPPVRRRLDGTIVDSSANPDAASDQDDEDDDQVDHAPWLVHDEPDDTTYASAPSMARHGSMLGAGAEQAKPQLVRLGSTVGRVALLGRMNSVLHSRMSVTIQRA